jgi:hypothetical protein
MAGILNEILKIFGKKFLTTEKEDKGSKSWVRKQTNWKL